MSLLKSNSKEILEKFADYDLLGRRDVFVDETIKTPKWLHFGSGNIFRAYIANVSQKMILKGYNQGVIVCESFDSEILDKSYKENDNICLSSTINFDGSISTKLISSICKSLCLNTNKDDRSYFINAMSSKALQIVSFTVTEKAYEIFSSKGELLPVIKEDLNKDLEDSCHLLSNQLLGLKNRFINGAAPITFMALDNCNHNGDKLKSSIYALADLYHEKGQLSSDFIDYLHSDKVSFPLSMIDKIAPRPSEHVLKHLQKEGVKGLDILKTAKGTFISDFVNSEPTAYLVVEDSFTNGRPPFELANVVMTDRHTVELCENMKIETCLNPLQTAAAISGMLFSYPFISDCMNDNKIVNLVTLMGKEGIKIVEDPKVIDPNFFLNEALTLRMPNKYIYDTPHRIATDSSSKISVRCGLTIKKYLNKGLNPKELLAVPLVIALFVRYVAGVDDFGNKYQMPGDLNSSYLKYLQDKLFVGNPSLSKDAIEELLNNQTIMGCNLKEAGIFDFTQCLCLEMFKGYGAVANTLEKYLL